MAGKNISYIKQETPSFIQKFKEKVGYKEPENVDTKFAEAEKGSSDDETDREGEKPVVVLGTNVSQEEADDFITKQLDNESETEELPANDDEEEQIPEDGKLVFKKPTKRKTGKTGLSESKKDKTKKKKSSNMKQVKNANLLSFGDDEEDEDEE